MGCLSGKFREIKMSHEFNHNRRRFLRNVTVAFAAAELATIGSAGAQSNQTSPPQVPQIRPGTNTLFGSLKQIKAGLLNVGYAEAGPADGPAAIRPREIGGRARRHMRRLAAEMHQIKRP
jgi:hypothetical protein